MTAKSRTATTPTPDEMQRIKDLGKLKALSLRQLLNTQFAPKEPLLDPIFYTNQSMLCWANSGTGKSWLTTSIGLAVAGAGKVFGWRAPKPRKTLLVEGEMDLRSIQERIRLLLPSAIEGIDVEAAQDNLDVVARTGQDPTMDFVDISNPLGHTPLLKMITEKYKAELVIFDNLTVLSDSMKDENSAGADGLKPVCSFLLKLKAAGVATILVTHSNKSGLDFRGSSALAATFDLVCSLKKNDDAAIHQQCSFLLEFQKFRERRSDATEGLKVRLDDSGPLGEKRWVTEVSEDRNISRLLALVKSLEYTSQAELAEAMGVSQPYISTLRKQAISGGRITSTEWMNFLNEARATDGDEGF